ncbi:hypothetical protein A3J61_02020 [Candidatus Nomurabacteria bacterium RIFCSPHIGHO2_02_FULL_38_15]|uniref:Uncharacterized protein n=1 Tax=Candidatus Nomurabacteria bacterium RIFCSPHIGHO2_02_FULL_38_15 TaxID=1801752 RepID=A0A1F6VRP4_9BACT|nr:MAG: hypothetical protein A3J61_02020 [Candidatus Nomurabacteria bacterium RIFCSPHIGHO2_02_FULL_38_15]
MNGQRTLLMLLQTIKSNVGSLSGAGRANQAHDQFIARAQEITTSKEEKKEALVFLREQNDLEYPGIGIDSLICLLE